MPSKDERLGTRTGGKDRCVVRPVARQRLNCRSAALLTTTALVALSALAARASRSLSAGGFSAAMARRWRVVQAAAAALSLMAGVAPVRATVVIDGGTTVSVPETMASPWNVGTNLIVGDTSAGGTLIIDNGGRVTSGTTGLIPPPDALDIAVASGSVGVMMMTGAGSFYSVSGAGEIHLGCATCTATLEVLNDSVLIGANTYGLRSYDGVTMVVDGAGSELATQGTGTLDVGFESTGVKPTTLTVSNGGLAVSGSNTGSGRPASLRGRTGVLNEYNMYKYTFLLKKITSFRESLPHFLQHFLYYS